MPVSHLNTDTFSQTAMQDGYTLIDFSAEWCPPCKVMKPMFASLAENEDNQRIRFCEVDIDNEQEIASAYQVSSIPTFILLKSEIIDGTVTLKEVKRWIGLQRDPLTFQSEIQSAAV